MCSWCYGFSPTWKKLLADLPSNIKVTYVHGGLAPHSDEPMPKNMQSMLESTWRQIETQTQVTFNFNFWSTCEPRRSTYLACQACIATRLQGKEYEMIQAIQESYYQKASNPSNRDTLEVAAKNCGLDSEKFSHDLQSDTVVAMFHEDLKKRRELGINGFPSLVYHREEKYLNISIDYNNYEAILKQLL
jgi:putative protein-disulfide isomerase